MKSLSQSLAAQVHASCHLSSIPQAIEELIFNSKLYFCKAFLTVEGIDAGATRIQIT